MKSLFGSKLNLVTLAAVGIMVFFGVSVNLTDSLPYVELINTVCAPFGIATAILLGIVMAKAAVKTETGSRTAGQPLSRQTVVLFIVAAVLMAFGAVSVLPYLWIGAIAAVLLALLANAYARPGRTAPAWVKALLLIGAFAAGALPGLVLYAIISVIVSDRYCQLTSSKCM